MPRGSQPARAAAADLELVDPGHVDAEGGVEGGVARRGAPAADLRPPRVPSDSSAVTIFADDAPDASAAPDAVPPPAAEEKRREAAEAAAEAEAEAAAELEMVLGEALEGVEDPDAPAAADDVDSSPLPPYVRHRGTVREDPVVAVDLGKKAKVKDAPTAANTYAAKKTVAQGMMDIALITSNANQLRYLFEFARDSDFFHLNIVLIVISLMLQIAVGVTLIFKGRADLSGAHKMAHANRLNNYVVGGVFLVTIINVFLAAFSVSNNNKHHLPTPPSAPAASATG